MPSGGAGVGLFLRLRREPRVNSNVSSTQIIAGHIYLCDSGSRTTSEVSGGTIGADGAGLTTVSPTANPSAPTDVIAGTYTMTADQSLGLPARHLWWPVVTQRSGHLGDPSRSACRAQQRACASST